MNDQNQNNENTHDLYAVRLQKLEGLIAEGKNPFLDNCTQAHTSEGAKALFDGSKSDESQAFVQVAGRIVSFRLWARRVLLSYKIEKGRFSVT